MAINTDGTYGKRELHQLLRKEKGFTLGFRTFKDLLLDYLDYSEKQIQEFNSRRWIKPAELRVFMNRHFNELAGE